MRRIVKGAEPEELRLWKEENAETPQILTYNNMPKAGVKLQMLTEQGYLCAYTMERIQTAEDCHIERVVPRNEPKQPIGHQIDYNNLLACVPSNTPGHRPLIKNFPYGAPRKNGTRINENNFVSPLRYDVEYRFRYAADGSIASLADDVAAANTITMLNLNDAQLSDLRKAAIEEHIWDADLSADEAEALSHTIMTANSTGKIPEFCLAISQVATWYATNMKEIK